MMASLDKLCLQWNDFKENITFSFKELKEDREFTDVTLACEDGQQVEAHKVVLASASPFFMELLKKHKHPHPLVYMRGLQSEDLLAVIDFLYCGEANIFQDNLDSFLALAQELRLKGLTGGPATEAEKDPVRETPQTKRVPLKTELAPKVSTAASQSTGCYDTTVSLPNDRMVVELHELDEKINSMITKSDLTSGTGQGRMATCNVCGKEAPFKAMPRHIEANHITGVVHSCDICGKTARSRQALSMHKINFHNINKLLLQD